MSSTFSQRKESAAPSKRVKSGLVATLIERAPGVPAVVTFSNGKTGVAVCLRCPTTPCMTYADSEVISRSLPEFPADRNPAVCPADAMVRSDTGAPVVNSSACMYCGVCALRCPVSAISMMPHAVVNDTQSDYFPETQNPQETLDTLSALLAIPRTGPLLVESDGLVDDLMTRLNEAGMRIGDRFPDNLVRNLLIAVGVGAAMRRKGDNAARIDIVLGPPWPEFGCVEVEFGDVAVLDAPRDLMDDVAVSIGRLAKRADAVVALVVTDLLPNRRSEYWRIVEDVKSVLEIQIGTVTVFALCLLAWHGKRLCDASLSAFYVDSSTKSYRATVLESLLGRKLRIGNGRRPWVEVAK